LDEKAEAIQDACKWRDIAKLRSFAESAGGLLNDELRGIACMLWCQLLKTAAFNIC
jgi:hypothetical protein